MAVVSAISLIGLVVSICEVEVGSSYVVSVEIRCDSVDDSLFEVSFDILEVIKPSTTKRVVFDGSIVTGLDFDVRISVFGSVVCIVEVAVIESVIFSIFVITCKVVVIGNPLAVFVVCIDVLVVGLGSSCVENSGGAVVCGSIVEVEVNLFGEVVKDSVAECVDSD